MNREEVDAKIAASEARTDSKFAAVIARLDALTAELREFKAEFRTEIRAEIAKEIGRLGNVKMTVILTGISTALAIIFGVAGFNTALLNNMIASYESGKERAQWQSEAKRQVIETDLALVRVRKRLEETEALQKKITEDYEKFKQEQTPARK